LSHRAVAGGLLQILDATMFCFEIGVNFLDETETAIARPIDGRSGEVGEVAGCAPRRRDVRSALLDPAGDWRAAMIVNWCLPAPRRRREASGSPGL
jgi:hypothetical protein